MKKKPYVEDVEGKGRPDNIVAEEAWEGFLKRNQSIIVDHLFGPYIFLPLLRETPSPLFSRPLTNFPFAFPLLQLR